MTSSLSFDTPIGTITLTENQGNIVSCQLGKTEQTKATSPLLENAKQQIEEYFSGKRKKFNLPLAPQGTSFQQNIWKILQTIPYGQTLSYKEIAQKANHPKAYRAVGMANNKNPIMIIIPCHRIVGSNGKLVGYAGGLEKKKFLLDLETKNK